MGKNFVLTFQEKEGDLFDPVRKRLINENGRLRTHNADYLLYALYDIIIDHYFIVCEKIQDHMDNIEAEVLSRTDGVIWKLFIILSAKLFNYVKQHGHSEI